MPRPDKTPLRKFDRIEETGSPPPSYDTAKEGVLYVVNEDGEDRMVRFFCPGGCGLIMSFPIGKSPHNPLGAHWKFDKATGTMSPSIGTARMAEGGFCCHYFINNMNVNWCADSKVLTDEEAYEGSAYR